MSLTLDADDFALFDVPRQFEQDARAIDARWKQLQREVHPDRFVAQGTAAQRVAMQWSVRINEAVKRLRSPLLRAAYLCELGGAPIQANDNTAMPAAFLMQQMAWRETLDDATELRDVLVLEVEVVAYQTRLLAELAGLIDRERDFVAAAGVVRSLMFVERFTATVGQRKQSFES
jgi:molecular chaperone HscB